RPSRSSASNIGAEKRKVKRWKKFIDCRPGRLEARGAPLWRVSSDRMRLAESRRLSKSEIRPEAQGSGCVDSSRRKGPSLDRRTAEVHSTVTPRAYFVQRTILGRT